MNRSLAQRCLVVAVLLAIGICGYWLLFTQFMVYDDEGYVLWSLHSHFAEGGLYAKVYSQYGPFIYALYHVIHTVFRLTFDNETGRLITLFFWVGSSSLAGLFTWSQTRNIFMVVGTICLTFCSLIVMTSEPIHPGGILAFMSALGGLGGAIAIERRNHRLLAITCGTIGTAMLLTKINVGAFFLIASGSWLAISMPNPKLSRACLWLSAIGSLLVPFWLMQKLWPDRWVAIFALVFSLSALSVLHLIKDANLPKSDWKSWQYFIGSAAGVMVIIVGMIGMRGTSLKQLWHGVVTAPLGQPLAYSHPINWPWLIPVLSVGLFILSISTPLRQKPWFAHVIVALRLGVAIGFLTQSFGDIENKFISYSFLYGLPFVWVMLLPLYPGSNSPLRQARYWLAWVFLWQTLHAYPVAGSQMGWGSFMWVPLAVVGCFDAVIFWAEKFGRWQRTIKGFGGAAFLVCCGALVGDLGYWGHYRYSSGQPLAINGAAHLRLPDNLTGAFRVLDQNIRYHGGLLFSLPGMFSYNIWTGHPTPTAANVTHWFSLLSNQQQLEIVAKLESDEQAVLVVQSYLVNYLIDQGFPPRGVLQQYIVNNFAPVFRIDTFEFWAKKGRTVAPIATAKLHLATPTKPAILELVTTAEGKASKIVIRGLFHPYNQVFHLPINQITPWQITSLHADNSPIGPTETATSPITLQGLSQIKVALNIDQRLSKPDILKVVILDAEGNSLQTLQFSH